MIYYYETEKYIFVHSWVPCNTDSFGCNATKFKRKINWRDSPKREWNSAVWYNNYKPYQQKAFSDKIIICGHCDSKIWKEQLNMPPFDHQIFITENAINVNANIKDNHRCIDILTLDKC